MMISKMIIPAAGIGSRFLPITKTIPKEMLPLSHKPAIEYIVQEAIDASISNISIVLSPDKKIITDYFSYNAQLDAILKQDGKSDCMKELYSLIAQTSFSYYIQNQPKGLADALLQAQSFIDREEYFAVALPDDIIVGDQPEIGQLASIAQQHKVMVIAVQQVPQDKISSYGVIAPRRQVADNCFEIDRLIEKPSIEQAPSDLAIVGRYVFHHDLFTYIPQTLAPTGEILLPDTINLMIQQGYRVYAVQVKGQRFDTGTPVGWLQAVNTLS
ncbi:MAG: UTP--glucose-1-phosphate uridylyltransferase [Epsilonproteobacteria bacterium]|nr:UTP--glucose-1-phosphate uridylyltransferase [Campylobacterota bacterium]